MDSFISDTQKTVGAGSSSLAETILGTAGDIFFSFINPPDPYQPEGEGFDDAGQDLVPANPKKKKPAVLRKEFDNRNKQLREGAFLGTLHLPLDHAADFAQTTRKKQNEEMSLEKTEAMLESMVPGLTKDGPLAGMKQSDLRKNQHVITKNLPKKIAKEKDKEKQEAMKKVYVKTVLDLKKAADKMKKEIDNCALKFEELKENYPKSKTALQQLIEEGADINSVDQEGFTALMLAARNGHVETVRALLEIPKIEANKLNNFKANAMHYAAMYAHRDVVKLLRFNDYQKVDKKQKNALDKTPNEMAKMETADLMQHKKDTWEQTYKNRHYLMVPEMGKKDAGDNPIYNALGIHDPDSVDLQKMKEFKPDRWRLSKIQDPACQRDAPFTEKEFLKRWDRAAKQC